MIAQETRDLIDKLLLEKLPLTGIALSYWCIRKMVADIRQHAVHIYAKKRRSLAQKKGRLTIQCDEMWSFVATKKNKQWVWLALDIETKEIVGVYVGARSRAGAEGLWQSLPARLGSVQYAIPTSGLPIMRFFQHLGIELLVKKVAKLT